MVKTGHIKRCQGLNKLERHVVAMRTAHTAFYSNEFQETLAIVKSNFITSTLFKVYKAIIYLSIL